MTGIYCIKNIEDGKVYIGQSRNISTRFTEHRWMLRHGCHTNLHLQHAWNYYGEASFQFTILELCDESILTQREDFFIESYGGLNSNNTYNMIASKDHGGHSISCRQSISKTLKHRWSTQPHPNIGKKRSEEVKASMSGRRKGYKHSEETKQKISASQQGKTLTDEHRAKLSELARGRVSPFKGHHWSEEQRRQMSEARKGIPVTPEKLAKLRKVGEARRGTFGRPVLQYSKDGVFLQEFISLSEACRQLGLKDSCSSSITAACRGQQPTAYGYVWKYKST